MARRSLVGFYGAKSKLNKVWNGVGITATVLTYVGALNWGLIGILKVDVVDLLFSSWPMVKSLIYSIIGVSAVASGLWWLGKWMK